VRLNLRRPRVDDHDLERTTEQKIEGDRGADASGATDERHLHAWHRGSRREKVK
jgi:hypothetical protein